MTDIDRVIEKAKAAVLPFESWERLTGESSAAYAAFCAYRDYGPDRNIRRAVEGALSEAERGRVEQRYRMWRAWSTQFRWRERAADYDQYLDRLKLTEKRKTIEAQEAVYRETIRKMLRVVNKKLDGMAPGELTQGSVGEWLTIAVKTDHELAGITAAKGERDSGGKQLEIQFTPEFEGL